MDNKGVARQQKKGKLLREIRAFNDLLETLSGTVISLGTAVDEIQRDIKHIRQTIQPVRPTRPSRRRDNPYKDMREDMVLLRQTKVALQKNTKGFVDGLDLTDGNILDILYQDNCLLLSEYEAIKARNTNKEQVRLLIVKLQAGSLNNINIFLDTLKAYPNNMYGKLLEKVDTSLEAIKQKKESTKGKCVTCDMKAMVDVADIADHMRSMYLVSDDVYVHIAETGNAIHVRELFWRELTASAIDTDSADRINNILIEALVEKYPHFADYIKKLSSGSRLDCCCARARCRQKVPRCSYDSATDMSTTSSCYRSSDTASDRQSDPLSDTITYSSATKVKLANGKMETNLETVESECAELVDSGRFSIDDGCTYTQSGEIQVPFTDDGTNIIGISLQTPLRTDRITGMHSERRKHYNMDSNQKPNNFASELQAALFARKQKITDESSV